MYSFSIFFLIIVIYIILINSINSNVFKPVSSSSLLSSSSSKSSLLSSSLSSLLLHTSISQAKFLSTNASSKSSKNIHRRNRRSILQLAGMIRCVTGCDPTIFQGYGCYCGFMGAGKPVDLIDRCCLKHDWCYERSSCMPMLTYFVRYNWDCIAPGYAQCAPNENRILTRRCSDQLCECDRRFAECLSNLHCPIVRRSCPRRNIYYPYTIG